MSLMRKHLSKIFFLCGLIGLLLSVLNANFLANNFSDKNLVYCPLQKTWVKRHEESQSINQNPFEQICMSNEQKQFLSAQVLFKKAFAIDEKGIFETLKFGVKSLDNYKDFPNSPQQTLAVIKKSFSLLTSKDDTNIVFLIKQEAFSFALNSRPPTVQISTKFDFQISHTLDQISRNINPRSPPFLI